jgi:hypothetical protein
MYDLIFTERLPMLLAAALLSFIASALAGARKLWMRGLFFNLAPAMGAAFYVVSFIPKTHPNSLDLASALIFEFVFLIVFYKVLALVFLEMSKVDEDDAVKVLKWAMLLHLLTVLPNIGAAGFGIFSQGSRIDYLFDNRFAKYLTYGGIIISIIEATFLARLLSIQGKISSISIFVFSLNFTLSVLSGSKGAVFLWIAALLSLIDYRSFRFDIFRILILSAVGLASLYFSALIVANFSNLDLAEFFDLAISRFFLYNDARALALDLRPIYYVDSALFSESFRSLAGLFGAAPQNEPLGILLYRQAFFTDGVSGANASLMALVVYYTAPGYSILPILIATSGLFLVFYVSKKSLIFFQDAKSRLIVITFWTGAIMNYSQDFLAFQVFVIITLALIIFLFIIRPKSSFSSGSYEYAR